jgi:hypothetical protein
MDARYRPDGSMRYVIRLSTSTDQSGLSAMAPVGFFVGRYNEDFSGFASRSPETEPNDLPACLRRDSDRARTPPVWQPGGDTSGAQMGRWTFWRASRTRSATAQAAG